MTAEIIEGYFVIIQEDMEAAERLMNYVPRATAYHLEHAAEKLAKAILVAEEVEPGISHDIATLADMLPDGHEWKADLASLSPFSRFATAFRYPTATGRVSPAPDVAELKRHAALIRTLRDDALDWCRDRVASKPRP